MDKTETPQARERIYPWHQELWAQTVARRRRLSHALLLHGQAGLGKNAFALRLAHWLLCLQPGDTAACGECKSCLLLKSGNHPDLQLTRPAEAGKPVAVDQVRALGEFVHLRPHIAPCKVVVLTPAEAMNVNAANSLLKVLEEPPPQNTLILVSHNIARLPVTVRSRCAGLLFRAPSREPALDWLRQHVPDADAGLMLALAGGAPLTALERAGAGFAALRQEWLADVLALAEGRTNPLDCAGRWKEQGAEPALGWFHGLLADLVRLALAAPGEAGLANPDQAAQLQDLGKRLNLRHLLHFYDSVSETRRLLETPLDKQLLIEDTLIGWERLSGPARGGHRHGAGA